MTYPTWYENDDVKATARVIVDHMMTEEFKSNKSMNFETKFGATLMSNMVKAEMRSRGIEDYAVFALTNTESVLWIKYHQPD